MRYNIFLDDRRKFEQSCLYPIYDLSKNWIIIRNYDSFVEVIDKLGIPDFISFDHDLGSDFFEDGREKNGKACANYLVEKLMDLGFIKCPDYVVHSDNPWADNITSYLESYKKEN